MKGAQLIIEEILNAFNTLREFLSDKNDALVSRLDDIAGYWTKEKSYILKQFIK